MRSCEALKAKFKSSDKLLYVIGVYRHPIDDKNIFVAELDESLNSSENNEVILIGDIDIDVMQFNNSLVNKYESILVEHTFVRCISNYTSVEARENIFTQTCIDHIYFRSNKNIGSSVIGRKTSDHFVITAILGKGRKSRASKKGSSKIIDNWAVEKNITKFLNKAMDESTDISYEILSNTFPGTNRRQLC